MKQVGKDIALNNLNFEKFNKLKNKFQNYHNFSLNPDPADSLIPILDPTKILTLVSKRRFSDEIL